MTTPAEILRQLKAADDDASNAAASVPNIQPIASDSSGGPGMFIGRVESASVEGAATNYQWTYGVKQVYKSGAGYGTSNWTVVGDTVTAYNAAENINADVVSEGPYGNGVCEDELDINSNDTDDFTLQRIPTGNIVLVAKVPMLDTSGGLSEYWIVGAGMPNGLCGACPA